MRLAARLAARLTDEGDDAQLVSIENNGTNNGINRVIILQSSLACFKAAQSSLPLGAIVASQCTVHRAHTYSSQTADCANRISYASCTVPNPQKHSYYNRALFSKLRFLPPSRLLFFNAISSSPLNVG